ncbi:MAG: TA system antitoxin ParD family protein [Burkholderiaceae bacterium]
MAKSIRISDRLYESALADSELLHRSLAQQVEHWAEVGRALETTGLDVNAIKSLLGINQGTLEYGDFWMAQFKLPYQEATKEAVTSGRLAPESLRLVGQESATKAKVTYREVNFDD